MIDKAVAYALAREYLDKKPQKASSKPSSFFLDRKLPDLAETYEYPELVIDDEATQERPFGWIFFWNSKEYYETGDVVNCIIGNGPIVVDRCDRSIHELKTAGPAEKFIEEYTRNRNQNCE